MEKPKLYDLVSGDGERVLAVALDDVIDALAEHNFKWGIEPVSCFVGGYQNARKEFIELFKTFKEANNGS